MKEIDEIIDILKNTDIYEFKWENSSRKISLTRASSNRGISIKNTEEFVVNKSPVESRQVNQSTSELKNPVIIKSPMVGTFYRGPVGTGKTFIEKGSKIKKGQILYIIEAMKVIKEITSDIDGEILNIYIENGQPVEYGQFLFGVIPGTN
ncbi:acetyl-CoA carboxylase, biotin carboxyl carrier protein [Candidatus Desantisbacteria bacterium]|nr:acetyl-CoA carboxylase, biotin carboxyl carrier protein [Candidatus Desantisbacteria bacterium]